MSMKEEVRNMKLSAPEMASSAAEVRDRALQLAAEKLEAEKEAVFAENAKDLAAAEAAGVAPAIRKRLKFNEEKLADVLAGIRILIGLPDPVGKVSLDR